MFTFNLAANTAGALTQEKCDVAASLRLNVKFLLLCLFEVIFALIALISLYYLSRSKTSLRLGALLSPSLKAISLVAFLFYFACSTVNLGFYGYSMVRKNG